MRIFLYLTFLLSLSYCSIIFPPVIKQQLSTTEFVTLKNICNLQINTLNNIPFQTSYYFNKIIQRINKRQCESQLKEQDIIPINIIIDQSINKQGYQITLKQKSIQFKVSKYQGYVYAMESLSQLIQKDMKIPQGFINDEPLVIYRGIMIDSARHFLTETKIRKLIQTMPLVKLNILHWHLSDDQVFALKLRSHPELAQASIYTPQSFYSLDQIHSLLDLAQKNAIIIVPQIDTPAHVRSWGLSQKWKAEKITIENCPGGQGYNAQFDLSKQSVYTLAQQVLTQINQIFSTSSYLHLGGDQAFGSCWDLRPQIKIFMEKKNIKNYGELQMYWRSQLRKVLTETKNIIFWRNNAQGIIPKDNDILHYWGAQNDTEKVVGKANYKLILSPSDLLYLNKGQGFIWANNFGEYSLWKEIYQKYEVFPTGIDKNRIIGGEVCLWGEVSNDDKLQNNLWMRAAAFATRVWSANKQPINQLVKSLVKLQYILYDLGVQASPITSQFCQKYVDECFSINKIKLKAQ